MLDHEGPVYLRTGKSPVPRVLPDDHVHVPGRWPVVREGADVTLVGLGITVHLLLEAAALLEGDGISAKVVAASSFKPTDGEHFAELAAGTRGVVTMEDHNVRGGLASRVAELLAWHNPLPVESIGLEDRFAESGAAAALFEKYGLTAENAAARARRILERTGT
jgi:transketolase